MAIWNSKTKDDTERLTHEALETNVHFVDPNYNIIGREAFIDMVHAVQAKIPGATYSHVGKIDSHHNHHRYNWAIHMGEKLILAGFDVTETNDLGKVIKITGFFGESKPSQKKSKFESSSITFVDF